MLRSRDQLQDPLPSFFFFIWCSYTRLPQDGAIAPCPCTQLTPQIGRVALIFLTVTPENTRVCFDCLVSHSIQLIKLLLHSRWDALHLSNLFIFCLISFTTKSHGTMVFTRGRSMNAVKMEWSCRQLRVRRNASVSKFWWLINAFK